MALFALTSCKEEADFTDDTTQGTEFNLQLTEPSTRTNSDTAGNVSWTIGDGISIYHAESGKSYAQDGKFTIESTSDGNATASGYLASSLKDGKSYNWLMVYPYNYNCAPSSYSLTFGSDATGKQTQTGNNSKAHLAGKYAPLFGKSTTSGTATPTLKVDQLSSGVKVTVVNDSNDPLTVSQIEFTLPSPIVGKFNADFTGTSPVITAAGTTATNTAILQVKDAEPIAAGSSADFYLNFAPVTVSAGENISITITTKSGAMDTFDKAPLSDLKFESGLLNYTSVTFKPTVSTIPEGTEPAAYGALPSASQVEWQRQELIMFCHFGAATFTGSTGEASGANTTPSYLHQQYNPTGLNTDQWAEFAKKYGFKEIIITGKHHDGFSIFNNPYSDCGVNHTTNGGTYSKTDVLASLSKSCQKYGLKFGVYLSPWDKNDKNYYSDNAAYNQSFANTVTYIMDNYGPVAEFWFDGYNVSSHTYDWDLFNSAVLSKNPGCIIFSNEGTSHSEEVVKNLGGNFGCRWPGNEEGIVGRTNWSTFNHHASAQDKTDDGYHHGYSWSDDYTGYLEVGDEGGKYWVPTESDLCIHDKSQSNGWFWTSKRSLMSAQNLLDIYYKSVGRNSVMLLNVPPTQAGVLDESVDGAVLAQFKAYLDQIFATNYAEGATIAEGTSAARGSKYAAANVIDGNYDTYFAVEGDDTKTCSIVLKRKTTDMFNRIVLQEYIPKGQRVKSFSVYTSTDGTNWKEVDSGTTIGHKRILHFSNTTAQYVKVEIKESLAVPLINEIGLYYDGTSTAD